MSMPGVLKGLEGRGQPEHGGVLKQPWNLLVGDGGPLVWSQEPSSQQLTSQWPEKV